MLSPLICLSIIISAFFNDAHFDNKNVIIMEVSRQDLSFENIGTQCVHMVEGAVDMEILSTLKPIDRYFFKCH